MSLGFLPCKDLQAGLPPALQACAGGTSDLQMGTRRSLVEGYQGPKTSSAADTPPSALWAATSPRRGGAIDPDRLMNVDTAKATAGPQSNEPETKLSYSPPPES
jgi:hypothetical protein